MKKKYHAFFSLPRQTRHKLWLVALLYLAEGLPFGFIYITLPVYLRTEGVDLVRIGLLSLAGLAWTLKPLWAPLVDQYGRKWHWMSGALLGLSVSVFLLSGLKPQHPLYLSLVIIMAFFSATLDIAVDGYTIEILDEDELGPGNGVRVSAYRVALIASGGALVALSQFIGFRLAFLGLGTFFLVLLAMVFFWPACHRPSPVRRTNLLAAYVQPLKDLLSRPYIWAVIPFILLYKLPDALMGPMIYPFWVDRGFSRAEIGLVSGTLGTIFSIWGSLVGGWLTKILGLSRALWSLGALQALSNLGYAYAALPGTGRLAVYSASIIESFTGGLGTAAFLAFLMRLCRREMSASQYALLATLFSFSRTIAGALSGWGAERLGYATYFFYTFLSAFPAFLLLPWVLKSLHTTSKAVTISADPPENRQGGKN